MVGQKHKEKRWYDTVRWRKARASFLADHPLCNLCAKIGRDTAASIVDHIRPHEGDYNLFWDQTNWQSLCPTCHSGWKRIQENKGVLSGCDVRGLPLDFNHPWINYEKAIDEKKETR